MNLGSCAAVAVLLCGGSALADEARLLDQTGAGIVAVNDEKAVRVRGIEGEIILQTGEIGKVEFSSAAMAQGNAEVPLVLSTDGAAFGLAPPSGRPIVPTRLKLLVPPAMRVELDVSNASVHASQLDADLVVRGSRLRFDASGLLRRTQAEIDGGTVTIQGAKDGFALTGRDVDTALDGMLGATSLRLTGGSAKLTGLQAGLQGEFVRTRVGVDTIVGPVDLRFQEGKAQLTSLRDGGQIAVTGCKLVLIQASGDLMVTSDSEIQFSDCRASLHIENTSGGVNGIRNEGLLEITTHKAAVNLSQISGQLKIAGDELEVMLKDIGAAITVNTHSSNIAIDGTSSVTVQNDRGSVVVKRSEALMEIKSRGGEVHLLDMHGPVTVDADGPFVEVEWTGFAVDRDCRIVNDGGEVAIRLSAGDARVSAVSQFGHVDSNVPGLRVLKDDTTAEGILGGGSNRTIVVKASGDIHLLGPDAADSAGQTP